MTGMDVSVIQIGNSKGIRLSKYLLERYNIKDTVEMILEKGHIIIKPKAKPRKGWCKIRVIPDITTVLFRTVLPDDSGQHYRFLADSTPG
jgi:hypothetical protein